MKIGIICKYPPIVGGVSAKAYWLSRALAEKGNEIHIITNAREVEPAYRQEMDLSDIDLFLNHPNIKIHATPDGDVPAYIPKGNPFEIKLANLALGVIERHGLDVIDCWYFVPNGVAGFLVHTLSGIPWILRHAGSDLGRILPHQLFETVLTRIIQRANKVVTNKTTEERLIALGVKPENLWFNQSVSVDARYFNPEGEVVKDFPNTKPVILSIGKIGNAKGTYDLLKSFAMIKEKAYLVFVTGGPNLNRLKREIKLLGMGDNVKIFPPVPPWRIPNYFRSCYCYVHAERDFPIVYHRPIIPREAIACGTCMILSEEMYAKYNFLTSGENVITVNPHNHSEFSETLNRIISNPALTQEIGRNAHATALANENFSDYVNHNLELYNSLVV